MLSCIHGEIANYPIRYQISPTHRLFPCRRRHVFDDSPLDSPKDASRRVLKAKPHGVVRGKKTTSTDKRIVQQAKIRSVIFPWMKAHQYWWDLTVLGAMFTIFFEPYQIAFQEPQDGFVAAAVEHIMTVLFSVDLVINFNLAFYENEEIVFERKRIVQSYCRRMFWVDLLACFPITNLVLAATGQLGETTNTALLISLLRLLRLLRLHRMGPMSDILQYSSHVSLMWFTLLRNFAAALVVTHFAACTMYLLTRLDDFSQDTWLGPLVDGMSITERYIASLYWSVGTLSTLHLAVCCLFYKYLTVFRSGSTARQQLLFARLVMEILRQLIKLSRHLAFCSCSSIFW